MKPKYTSLIILLLLGSVLVIAFPVEDLKIKFMSPEINQTKCMTNFEKVPDKYYKGLKAIYIYPKHFRLDGFYLYKTHKIILYTCSTDVIVHELAHYKNDIDGISLFKSKNHKIEFEYAYTEINNGVKRKSQNQHSEQPKN